MKKQLSALALLLCWLTTANAAALLYDSSDGRTSFRPGSSLSLSFGWLVRDFRPTWADTVQLPAMPFVLSSAAELQSVDLALTALAFWSQDYRVRVPSRPKRVPRRRDDLGSRFTRRRPGILCWLNLRDDPCHRLCRYPVRRYSVPAPSHPKTARAPGLILRQSLLLQATEVIE